MIMLSKTVKDEEKNSFSFDMNFRRGSQFKDCGIDFLYGTVPAKFLNADNDASRIAALVGSLGFDYSWHTLKKRTFSLLKIKAR